MSQTVSRASFEPRAIPMPQVNTPPSSACCQRAVNEALETAASMGSIATVSMLAVGFAAGLTAAWVLFG